jgi:hypothetical protein
MTDVLLVVSELVANAVEHDRGRIEMRVELDDEPVRGEVAPIRGRDSTPTRTGHHSRSQVTVGCSSWATRRELGGR